jgi:hypothetical protein
MNKPITPQQMSDWIKEEWKKKQDEAWENPKLMAVLKCMKDR